MRLDPHYSNMLLHFLAQAHFSLGQYEAAATRLLERIARNPDTDASRMLLAACYGHLGRAEDARAIWADCSRSIPRSRWRSAPASCPTRTRAIFSASSTAWQR